MVLGHELKSGSSQFSEGGQGVKNDQKSDLQCCSDKQSLDDYKEGRFSLHCPYFVALILAR